MSVATDLHSHAKPISETRAILGPGGNRVRVYEESKCRNEVVKKPQRPKKLVSEITESVVRNNVSVDSSCSSDSSSGGSLAKLEKYRRLVKHNGSKPVKVVPEGGEVSKMSLKLSGPQKRCDWITPYSDPLYITFHDEEWGVPVHDDSKLFELLVFSLALAELSWPTILTRRDIFRKALDHFEPSSVAQFTEKKLLTLKVNGVPLLSEPKLRAIVENAKQIIKIQQEFGSFSNYCWSFVNKKPIQNGFRYARQVPVKTPKAEVMSKDLMQRGLRCVGTTVIYSFMQVAGIVNDHLVTCFRYHECSTQVKRNLKPKVGETEESLTEASENRTNAFLPIDSETNTVPD